MEELIRNLVVFLWAPLLLLALIVILAYAETWKNKKMGLLPSHVTLIAISYLTLATRDAYEVAVQPNFNWYNTGFVVFSLISGLIALFIIARYERLRIKKER